MNKLFPALLFFLLSAVSAAAEGSIVVDDFERGLSPAWTETAFEGNTLYTVVAGDGGKVLRAVNHHAASGLSSAM